MSERITRVIIDRFDLLSSTAPRYTVIGRASTTSRCSVQPDNRAQRASSHAPIMTRGSDGSCCCCCFAAPLGLHSFTLCAAVGALLLLVGVR